MSSGLPSRRAYRDRSGSVAWEGREVQDADGFTAYLGGVVRDRVRDADDSFEAEIRGLATTEMATEFLAGFLAAVPDPEDWEIGEALAECLLAEDVERDVCWPWNTVRDRRTPRASLPGADLVGFCRHGGDILLLFGEVKTSAETRAPPSVMRGGSGMAWQLYQEATRLEVQHALIRWLRARCSEPEHRELYRAAVGQYLGSGGEKLLLVGALLRDTQPDERDLRDRARELARKLPAATHVELIAWYFPIAISNWVRLAVPRDPS